ncbi:MAG: hypothetical protein E7385_04590 [Ruminococcaceae bacterium]|nr:hypothetical protein [Oscillospiraceae bacterium]
MKYFLLLKKAIFLITSLILLIIVLGCQDESERTYTITKYNGPYSEVNGAFGGVDDLGRTLLTDIEAGKTKQNKTVGIFYFLCAGAHSTKGPYDISKILKKDPRAFVSDEAWIAAGGGSVNTNHFWSEPLFGYYLQTDEWVVRKHVQMLADADIDYMILDTTNGNPHIYTRQSRLLLEILDDYASQGYDVPQIAYYTNAKSGETMDAIYNKIYSSYPEYHYLWFQWDGKPLMIGKEAEASEIVKETFRIKASQWPNEKKNPDGWPWIEFDRNLTADAVYGINGRKEIVSVSPCQHSFNLMSTSAFYGGYNQSRSFHNGKNEITQDSVLYGYNFAEQFEWAIAQDTETIFITQWNEWAAGRMDLGREKEPICFVDTATPEYSRDIEPMKGGFGDNYYMQMCYYIQKYKGTEPRVYIGEPVNIDVNGDFSQWDSNKITAKYLDCANDIIARDSDGYGKIEYINQTGRNDIVNMKVAQNQQNLYFYMDSKEPLILDGNNGDLALFLNTGKKDSSRWYGYDYVVVITGDKDCTLKRCTQKGTWVDVCGLSVKVEVNKLMLCIPRIELAIIDNDLLDIQFKWADNFIWNDIWSFYTDGDSAPYGRLNYVYSEKKIEWSDR